MSKADKIVGVFVQIKKFPRIAGADGQGLLNVNLATLRHSSTGPTVHHNSTPSARKTIPETGCTLITEFCNAAVCSSERSPCAMLKCGKYSVIKVHPVSGMVFLA